MPLEIQHRGRQVFLGVEALVEILCFDYFFEQFLWNRFPGFIMHRIILEDLRLDRPVLLKR